MPCISGTPQSLTDSLLTGTFKVDPVIGYERSCVGALSFGNGAWLTKVLTSYALPPMKNHLPRNPFAG
jgi:hypothetical protein